MKVINPAKSVFGPADKIVVPPSGIIAGVYSRTNSGRPGGVYDPPAGIDVGRMFGVLGFETDEVLEERKRDLVYPKRVNPLTTGQQDRDGTTLRRWSLSRAWPVKFVAGDWDNEADENVIESVTLTYDFFELGAQ